MRGATRWPFIAVALQYRTQPARQRTGKILHNFFRYADDFVLVISSKRAGERVMASIKRFVERKLKLKVNDTKSQVIPGCFETRRQ